MIVPESLPNRPAGSRDATREGMRDDALREHLARVLAANYELEHEIGRGGMGIVYRARDRRLKRAVAVKLLPPDLAYRSDIRSRFLKEAETSAQLSHPSIVPIYTVEEADNLVFFIMGLVHGDTIAQRLRERGPMAPDEVRRALREVADALAYAHGRNVVHRDIKPDNVLLDNDSGRAMVTDFGIARAVSEGTDTRLTTTGLAIGTPAYMSPEQCAGDRGVDGRSDLYSLGVLGYQMLSGDLPFAAANTPAMFVKHLTERPRPLTDRCAAPADLDAVVMRCLEKDPADRFPSAAAMVDALDGRAPVAAPRSAGGRPEAPVQYGAQYQAQNPAPYPAQYPMRPAPDVRPSYSPANPTERVRWEAPQVRKYRKGLVTWLAFSAAFIPLGIIGDHAFFFADAMWGIGIASGYAKLWNKGYDWRDVFRQPRDALFADVVNEKIDDARALFDVQKREASRERLRARMRDGRGLAMSPPLMESLPAGSPARGVTGFDAPVSPEVAASYPVVQEAAAARSDIHRMMDALPSDDRKQLPDVVASADALYGRIELLVATMHDLDRANVPGLGEATEREVNELEAEANPLDEDASERRALRLAQLRRQRISLRDLRSRRDLAAQKLARCVTAMQSMRLDLSRLATGTRSYQSVTQVAEQAMQLGREVDAVLYAQDEIARTLQRKG
ncbi:MAG: protein kinase domain-containing protein [Gemmatimonadaceae bacterium]